MDGNMMEMMNSMMKELSKGDPEVQKQAQDYMKMLDDMSEKDPEAYKKFIKSNMEKGKDYMEVITFLNHYKKFI